MFAFRKSVAALVAAAASAACWVRRPARPDPQGRHAFGCEDSRSDLDHRLHRAQLRLHGVGHAVRDGREARGASRRWSTSTKSRPTSSPGPSPCATGWCGMTASRSPREDCIASIKRWGAKDSMGQKLMARVAGFEAGRRQDLQDEPEGAVRPGSAVAGQAVVERAVHDAQERRRNRPNAQIKLEDVIGSGPFIFKADEWKPGEKMVYVKNTKYKPRSEPASGLAGGKVVKVDRVEWIAMPDDRRPRSPPCSNGEIDMIEAPATTCCRCWPRTRTSSCSTPIRWATSTPSASTRCSSRSTTPRSATP